ncbi:hypothetical protein [Haloarcula onubensis]|uniref:Uncharacterized protein n=1 Tax=Haloarcula onubensis TaxID=2950539 RepID=A0ABU2FWW8_9EURY|nr:hypothetical protein [Halomicroarcula sp. S3CR25-11]MDS0284737.1 hypothetical protein [Halomicroarcula sp. S3CR25-11]
MTRPSRRDLERTVDELAAEDGKDWSAPLTAEEKDQLAGSVDVEAWDRRPKSREVLRGLVYAAKEARAT